MLPFTINGGKKVTIEQLVAEGYTVQFNTDRAVFDGPTSTSSYTGVLDPARLTRDQSFHYQVIIRKDGSIVASSVAREVSIISFAAYAEKITDFRLVLESGAVIPAYQLLTKVTQVDDLCKIQGVKALAKDGTSTIDLAPDRLVFESSNTNVAIVNDQGEITPVNEGFADIKIGVKDAKGDKRTDIEKVFEIEVVFGIRDVTTVTSSPEQIKLAINASRTIVINAKDQFSNPYAGFDPNGVDVTNAFGYNLLDFVDFDPTGADGNSSHKVQAQNRSGTGTLTIERGGVEYLHIPVDISDDITPFTRQLERINPADDLIIDSFAGSTDRTVGLELNQYNKDGYLIAREEVGTASGAPYRVVTSDDSIATVSVDAGYAITVTAQKAGTATISVLQGGIVVDSLVITVIDTTPGLDVITLKANKFYLNPHIAANVVTRINPYDLVKQTDKTPQNIDTLIEVIYGGETYDLVYNAGLTSPEHPAGGGWYVADQESGENIAKLFVKSSDPDLVKIEDGRLLDAMPEFTKEKQNVYLRFRMWDLNNTAIFNSQPLPVEWTDEIVIRSDVDFGAPAITVDDDVRVLADCTIKRLELGADTTVYVDPGEGGKVTFENCDLDAGNVVILSGGVGTITFDKTRIGDLSVNSPTPVKVVIKGGGTVRSLAIYTPNVTVVNENADNPVEAITLLSINGQGATVNNEGRITILHVNRSGARIINDGTIGTLATSSTLVGAQRPSLTGDNPTATDETSDVVVTDTKELLAALAVSAVRTIILGNNIAIGEEVDVPRVVTIDMDGQKITSTSSSALKFSGAALAKDGTIDTTDGYLEIGGAATFEEIKFEHNLSAGDFVRVKANATFDKVEIVSTGSAINISGGRVLTVKGDIKLPAEGITVTSAAIATIQGKDNATFKVGPVTFNAATRTVVNDVTFDKAPVLDKNVNFSGVTLKETTTFGAITLTVGEKGLDLAANKELTLSSPGAILAGTGTIRGGTNSKVNTNDAKGARIQGVTLDVDLDLTEAIYFRGGGWTTNAKIINNSTTSAITFQQLSGVRVSNVGSITIPTGAAVALVKGANNLANALAIRVPATHVNLDAGVASEAAFRITQSRFIQGFTQQIYNVSHSGITGETEPIGEYSYEVVSVPTGADEYEFTFQHEAHATDGNVTAAAINVPTPGNYVFKITTNNIDPGVSVKIRITVNSSGEITYLRED